MELVNSADLQFELQTKLAELEIELSEGDITEKGYQKKKSRIIEEYQSEKHDGAPHHASTPNLIPSVVLKLHELETSEDSAAASSSSSNLLRYQGAASSEAAINNGQHDPKPSSSTSNKVDALGRRPSNRRYARDDIRYRSEIREEAVKKALTQEDNIRPEVLRPSKRNQISSVVGVPYASESGDNLDSLEISVSSHIPQLSVPHTFLANADVFHKMSDPTPATKLFNLQTEGTFARSLESTATSADDITNPGHRGTDRDTSFRHASNSSQIDPFQAAAEFAAATASQQQSQTVFGGGTLVCPSRVSEKIQQLVNTLKRPKRRPLPEYFIDEDDQILVEPFHDPAAPRPLGVSTEPLIGEKLIVPSGLPRNIESALQRYAGLIGKTPALTCIDVSGKSAQVLTYSKLLQRSTRIAFLLLNKLGHRGEASLKPRDRVGLVYTSNDPISFLVAFYGCLLASVVPIAIEVPSRKDSICQNMGFLLSSQDARVVLTNEQVYKSLQRTPSGEIAPLPGWPLAINWINTDHQGGSGKKAPKDWVLPERLPSEETMYIEYTYAKDGSVRGVMVSRKATLAHCQALTAACNYSEEDVMVCVVDCRREAGLWHAALASVFNGMHVVFVPYNVLQVEPGCWIRMTTKYRASVAIVKSRDLHWALLAEREHSYAILFSLRALLVTDGHNPWSLNSCDLFANKFKSRGLNPAAICPIAGSPETLTLCLRHPVPSNTSTTGPGSNPYPMNGSRNGRGGSGGPQPGTIQQNSGSPAARGIISIHSLSYGVIRVDTEDSFTSLTLQDCGQVLPGAVMVVVSLGPKPIICRTDEVGELCISAVYTGSGYWGLGGQTGSHFCVQPVHSDGRPVGPPGAKFVRSGLIGFPGPASSGGLIFICGSIDGLLAVASRRHNANDVIATVIAVQPTKIVYRGRIAVFSIEMLKDERIVVVAELRQGFSEETAFSWMSQVLQAVDSIHQVSVYALALVPQNYLPRTPFGGIHMHEVRRLFSEGQLHPVMLLLCPHSAIQNLPQPRINPHLNLVGPSAMMVGQVIQGARMAEAHGRSISAHCHGSMAHLGPGAPDPAMQTLPDILMWRATHTPDDRLFSIYNAKGVVVSSLTCLALHRRAERLGSMLQEKGNINPGSVVALMYMPGTEMVCAFYACLYIAAIPVLVRPPQQPVGVNADSNNNMSSASPLLSSNYFGGSSTELSTSSTSLTHLHSTPPAQVRLESSLISAYHVVSSANAVVCLTQASIIKLIKSKEATSYLHFSKWPPLIDSEESWKKKLVSIHQPTNPETDVAYLDFAASTTGTLTGVEITHAGASALCRAQKMQCEFYPARELVLSLEPYSGLSASLWLLTSIYCGHHSIFVPPLVTQQAPDLWLTLCSQRRVREAFCSYATIKLATTHSARMISSMKMKEVTLDSLRSLVIVAEERPRVSLTNLFTKLFSCINLSPRAVSSSFSCRANLAMCLQGASSPDITTVYVDRVSLRNDRVNLLEKGSPNSLCLIESGKLLPGVHVAIANPDTFGQCADSHLGEIWVSSPHNSFKLLGPFNFSKNSETVSPTSLSGDSSLDRPPQHPFNVVNNPMDPLKARFVTGATDRVYARTGFLGFVRRTELTQSDGALHDAVFVVGNLEETMMLRGMRFYPMDIENTVSRSHKKIHESAVFTWSNLLVIVVEISGEESEALDLVHPITASVLREHQLIVGVVVVVDRGTVSIDLHGEKQRILLRDNFVSDKLDPIYVSYNM